MHINWAAFNPGMAALGGLMIGVASVLFALSTGRIAGISGIVGGVLRPRAGDVAWRLAFVVGLLAAGLAWRALDRFPPVAVDISTGTLVAAGLLVGIGTRLGSGCTSGHGVCGLSRLSPRSLAATLAFMATGFATVFVIRHLLP
jgi:uncharacterized membrane protein YedE/YeeE